MSQMCMVLANFGSWVYICVCSNESIIIDTSRCDRWKDLAMDLTRKMFSIVHCLSINTQKWTEGFAKRITLHFDQQITWNWAFCLGNILICDTFCAILSIQHFGIHSIWQWEVMILVCEPYIFGNISRTVSHQSWKGGNIRTQTARKWTVHVISSMI